MLWFPFLLLTLLWASCETTRQTWYHLDLTCASAFYYCQNSEILSVFSAFLSWKQKPERVYKKKKDSDLGVENQWRHAELSEPTGTFGTCWKAEQAHRQLLYFLWFLRPREVFSLECEAQGAAGMISISPSPLPSTPGGRQESCRGAAGCAEHRDGT